MGYSAAAAAFIVGGALASSTSKAKSPTIPAVPQAAQLPTAAQTVSGQAGTGQSGGSPGVAQTFLTGPGGIDPSLLNLGKSTLLGG
jgi:hypothetical protein